MSYIFVMAGDVATPSQQGRPSKGRPLEATKNVRLREARKAAGLSQSQLAARVGVTRQTICSIESGDYNPTLRLCVGICRALGKTLDDLFWEG